VNKINKGINPIEGDEPGLSDLSNDVYRRGFLSASINPVILCETDAIFVCVDFPVDEMIRPDLSHLRNAVDI